MGRTIVVGMDESFDRKSVGRLPATVARIVLGRWLKGLREHAGFSTAEAAERALLARATLWRMERGEVRCRYLPGDVELLAHLYQADEQKELLGDLATATKRWRELYPESLPDRVKEYLDLEAHAIRIDWYAGHRVPDLLRTKENVAAELVEVHQLRQEALGRSGPAVSVRVVLDEIALHAGDVMAEFPNVSVRVLRDEQAVHAGKHTGPFVVLGFPEVPGAGVLPGVVYRDVGEVAAVEPCEVALFQAVFDDVYGRAAGTG